VAGVIFLYLLGSLLSDAILLYDYYVERIVNSLVWLRLYTIFEVLLICIYFYLLLQKQLYKAMVTIGFSIFALTVIFFSRFHSKTEIFDGIPASTGAIICILFALLAFYQKVTAPPSAEGFINMNFWFSIGILIYMAGNLFMFLTYNSLNPAQRRELSAIIFPLMTIIRNIVFSIGMISQVKNTHSITKKIS
jgi:hypothetical protein